VLAIFPKAQERHKRAQIAFLGRFLACFATSESFREDLLINNPLQGHDPSIDINCNRKEYIMPPVMVARVTCSSCQNQFQTPIEQVLDVRADPGAKARVMNGMVNVAVCPHCRTGGMLNLPFFYHDPDEELALVYMPMEMGQDNLQRQKAIGDFTRAVMDDLPPEERKGYLLQPQVFLTMENLINRLLEAEGITPEMIEQQKAKADLLGRMLEATSDEALEAMVQENDDAIDDDVFRLLEMNLEMAQTAGQAATMQKLLALRDKLFESSTVGQAIRARSEVVEALRAEPTREKLLELLVAAPDEGVREMLITLGRPLLDYSFFQALTSRIEASADKVEKKQLTALRAQILEVRDRLDEEARALYVERAALLRDLLLSSDPENLARRRFAELDEVFFNVLAANLEEARQENNEEAIEGLQGLWSLVLRLTEETLPPAVRLFNRLMGAGVEAEIDELLQRNRPLVTERFVQFLESAKEQIQHEQTSEEASDAASDEAARKEAEETLARLEVVLAKARAVMLTSEDTV
jgi:hypothetical protein